MGSGNCCLLFLFCRRFFPFPPVFTAIVAGDPVTEVVASESPSGLDSLSSIAILTINNSNHEIDTSVI